MILNFTNLLCKYVVNKLYQIKPQDSEKIDVCQGGQMIVS